MKTKPWALFLILLCTLCTSSAAIANKKGAMNLSFTLRGTLFNSYLIIGLLLLGCAAVLLTLSLRGGDVSVIYPIIATSYIWVTLLSPVFFNEKITIFKILGILFIVTGVIVLNLGNKKEVLGFFGINPKNQD